MHYDREMERGRRRWREEGELLGRGEYGASYEAPFHGYAMGGELRSRGTYEAGQLRSGLNPEDEFEFEWGEGYVGGRGYGGTNYDLDHGYRVGGVPRYGFRPPERLPPLLPQTSPATRGGYSWSEHAQELGGEAYGPARYGFGPYYDRLQRRRRDDDEIRADVEESLFYDTWVDADRITVEVEDGVVTLSGTLPSFDEVRYATDDAWDVDGVRGVRSELEVGDVGRRAGGRMGRATREAGRGEEESGETRPRTRARTTSAAREAEGTTAGRRGGAARAKGRTAEGEETGRKGGTKRGGGEGKRKSGS